MKPQPCLQDMPSLIKHRIIDNLDHYFHKMSLKAAFPSFPIGNTEFQVSLAVFTITRSKIDLGFDVGFQYTFGENWSQVAFGENNLLRVHEQKLLASAMELARKTLKMLAENPNFRIGRLVVCVKEDDVQTVNLLSDQLKVEELELYCGRAQEDLLHILRRLDPGSLKSLKLTKTRFAGGDFQFDEVVKLEQWKTLERLEVMFDLPMELWWDFPVTEMDLEHVELPDLTRLMEHFAEAPRFKSSYIYTKFTAQELREALEEWEDWYDLSWGRLEIKKPVGVDN